MKVTVDTEARTLRKATPAGEEVFPLYSREAFEELSAIWLKVGWDQKYPYTFSWMGRPVIQLPEDLIRLQEALYRIKPDVVVETGIAHGGSLVFHASLLKAMGQGHVIGVDIEIRPHNRKAIQDHELASLITMVEGSSTAPEIVQQVRDLVRPGETVLVILDSNHTKAHVRAELEAYAPLVTAGSYIVATDGSMQDLTDVPRGKPDWAWDNPAAAAREFARDHPEFVLEPPAWPFNESLLRANITHWPDAWLRRR